MNLDFLRIEMLVWAAWIVSWFVAALWRGKRDKEAPRGSYRLFFLIGALGFYLLVLPVPGVEPLWRIDSAAGWSMVAMLVAGIAFAWWARLHMGALWSGGITSFEGHRVVQTGPFAIVRHPIYTGLATGALAIALTSARPTAFVGAILFTLGFALKARVEERFLEAELGGYAAYKQRVPMLVPGLMPSLFGQRPPR